MNDIWDYFKQLFQESEESSPSKPFIREAISRSDDEYDAFVATIKKVLKHHHFDTTGY